MNSSISKGCRVRVISSNPYRPNEMGFVTRIYKSQINKCSVKFDDGSQAMVSLSDIVIV